MAVVSHPTTLSDRKTLPGYGNIGDKNYPKFPRHQTPSALMAIRVITLQKKQFYGFQFFPLLLSPPKSDPAIRSSHKGANLKELKLEIRAYCGVKNLNMLEWFWGPKRPKTNSISRPAERGGEFYERGLLSTPITLYNRNCFASRLNIDDNTRPKIFSINLIVFMAKSEYKPIPS